MLAVAVALGWVSLGLAVSATVYVMLHGIKGRWLGCMAVLLALMFHPVPVANVLLGTTALAAVYFIPYTAQSGTSSV